MWAILDEAVVRRRVGSVQVMAEQLEHLRAAANTPHVTVQILPFDVGAHAAEGASFIIIRGPEPSLDVVHLSNLGGALYLEKSAESSGIRWSSSICGHRLFSPSDTSGLLADWSETSPPQVTGNDDGTGSGRRTRRRSLVQVLVQRRIRER